MGFVHNDVKLENILVGREKRDIVYLIDFGLSKPFCNQNGQRNSRT